MNHRELSDESSRVRELRIGVVLEDLTAPAWIANVLAQIESSSFGSIRLILLTSERSRIKKARHGAMTAAWMYGLYEWCDYRVFRAKSDAVAPVSVRDFDKEAKIISAGKVDEDNGWDSVLCESIKEAKLDLILDFSHGEAAGYLCGCARLGIWFCRFGSPQGGNDGLPDYYGELVEGREAAEINICCQRGGHIRSYCLFRGSSAIDRSSLYRTRNTCYWNAGGHIVRLLRQLYKFGWDHIAAADAEIKNKCMPEPYRLPAPTVWTTLRLAGRIIGQFFQRRIDRMIRRYCWHIAIARCSSADPNGPAQITLVAPKRGGAFADPHLFEWKGKPFLFFEYYPSSLKYGAIACLDLNSPAAVPVVVLQPPYHVSYPFLFEWHGDLFLLLESSMNNSIELYRCMDFPYQWEFARTLVRDISAVDATLVEWGGLFWLFAGIKSAAGLWEEELSLFYADSPLGPWHPHSRNPVVTDVRRARPAGRLFRRNGSLIRPGQDCSRRYGGSITLSRVDTLTPDEYCETTIKRIEPDWLPRIEGNHTIDRLDSIAVLDVFGPMPSRRSHRLRQERGDSCTIVSLPPLRIPQW